MKPLLAIISSTLLALAAAADPTVRGRFLNEVVATAWAQQDRGRGHDDREDDEDRGRGNDDKDRDEDDDRGRGNDDKDGDQDEDRGSGDDGDTDRDKDDDRGDGDEDRDQDEDRGDRDDDKDRGQEDDRGGGNDDKDRDRDDNQGRGNDKDRDQDDDPSGGDDPGSDDGPDVDTPRDDGEGSDDGSADPGGGVADLSAPDAEPAERTPDEELEGEVGELTRGFALDDTEMFDDDGFLARRGEILAMSADALLSRRAAALGLRVVEQERLAALETTVYRLAVPAGAPIEGLLARLRAQDPHGVFDRNHLYDRSAAPAASPSVVGAAPARALLGTAQGITVGLIDTGVDVLHPALHGTHVQLKYFVEESRVVPEAHGTAVVSLLVAPQFGLLPGAQLYVASVFYEDRRGGLLSEAQDLVRALAWLLERRVPVINLSLAGPPNEVLRAAIARALRAGHLIVAAVGNAGPAAPPLYPAAYEGVIGVTAVDAAQQVFRRANRGAQVEFAAVGVDVLAAAPAGLAPYSGTSFASPYVAALAALEHRALDAQAARAVRERLRSGALDLGKPGRDEVYGFGLVRPRTLSTAAAR